MFKLTFLTSFKVNFGNLNYGLTTTHLNKIKFPMAVKRDEQTAQFFKI